VWLAEEIGEIWQANRKVYGARRVHAELRRGRGIPASTKPVERLMRQAQISGLLRRRDRGTTIRVPSVRVAEADDAIPRRSRPIVRL
jgi:putative transposase